MAKSGYQNSETPEPIVTKYIWHGDYVSDINPHAKIQSDHPSAGIQANGWNMTRAWILYFFFLRP